MENNLINYIDTFYTFICDLLTLDDIPQLTIDDQLDTACAFSNGKVLLNINKFPKDNTMFLFMAIAHELRHAYQVQCLGSDEQDYFSESQLDIIQHELCNYVPHGANYKSQFIELDAFGFGEFIMNVCFNVKCTYNETFTKDEIDKIYDKAKEFKTVYSQDEIDECMTFANFNPIKRGYC